MMDNMYTLVSDSELNEELANSLLNRTLEQKFLYLWDWAELYYKNKDTDKVYLDSNITADDILDFVDADKTKKTCFISLWCGNSEIEKSIFMKLWKDLSIDYIWVDSSKDMLLQSMKNFKWLDVEKRFLCADIFTNEFRRELEQFTQWYDKRIFAFFSNTFGNKNHTHIIDILYNLLHKGEEIWMDVRLREGITAKDDMLACDYYYRWLKTPEQVSLYFNPLKQLWIPFDNWTMTLSTQKEESLNALKFQFSFMFTKKTTVKVRSDEITILPKEKIDLQQIYTYDMDWLIKFFSEHDFKLKDNIKKASRWFFIFEKQ